MALWVFHACGYFMSASRYNLEIVAGIVFWRQCATRMRAISRCRRTSLNKHEAILCAVIGSREISFAKLEKLAGKCTSVSVAVPGAILYAQRKYHHVRQFLWAGGRRAAATIAVSPNSGVRHEVDMWSEARGRLKGGGVLAPRCPSSRNFYRRDRRVIPPVDGDDPGCGRGLFRIRL